MSYRLHQNVLPRAYDVLNGITKLFSSSFCGMLFFQCFFHALHCSASSEDCIDLSTNTVETLNHLGLIECVSSAAGVDRSVGCRTT